MLHDSLNWILHLDITVVISIFVLFVEVRMEGVGGQIVIGR